MEKWIVFELTHSAHSAIDPHKMHPGRASKPLHQNLASGPAMEKWIVFELTHSATVQ